MRTGPALALAALLAAGAATLAPSGARAMNCGAAFDELTRAISGHLTMSTDRKAAMLRMAMSAYDSCSVGDEKSAAATRDMLMEQLKRTLGGR